MLRICSVPAPAAWSPPEQWINLAEQTGSQTPKQQCNIRLHFKIKHPCWRHTNLNKETDTSSSNNPSIGNTFYCCFYNTYSVSSSILILWCKGGGGVAFGSSYCNIYTYVIGHFFWLQCSHTAIMSSPAWAWNEDSSTIVKKYYFYYLFQKRSYLSQSPARVKNNVGYCVGHIFGSGFTIAIFKASLIKSHY